MKNKIMILLLIVTMCICGCETISNDKTAKISVKELQNMGYVIYEEDEIIDGIKEIYRGITIDAITSFAPTMDMIKESIPIENIREYSKGYIIEYPMKDRMFVIVTNKDGMQMGSFMRAYEERNEKDIRKIEIGMSEREVKALFPEIEISQFLESEIILSNNEIKRIVFEKKNKENIVKEVDIATYIFSESELEEIMNIDNENLMPKRNLLVIDGKLVKGEKQLEIFIAKTEKEDVSITGQKEILKIKYVYTNVEDEDNRAHDYILSCEDGKYLLESLDYNTGQTYEYLVKLKGKDMMSGNEEEAYFLTDNKDITYERLEFKILTSSSMESLDGRKLFLIN